MKASFAGPSPGTAKETSCGAEVPVVRLDIGDLPEEHFALVLFEKSGKNTRVTTHRSLPPPIVHSRLEIVHLSARFSSAASTAPKSRSVTSYSAAEQMAASPQQRESLLIPSPQFVSAPPSAKSVSWSPPEEAAAGSTQWEITPAKQDSDDGERAYRSGLKRVRSASAAAIDNLLNHESRPVDSSGTPSLSHPVPAIPGPHGRNPSSLLSLLDAAQIVNAPPNQSTPPPLAPTNDSRNAVGSPAPNGSQSSALKKTSEFTFNRAIPSPSGGLQGSVPSAGGGRSSASGTASPAPNQRAATVAGTSYRSNSRSDGIEGRPAKRAAAAVKNSDAEAEAQRRRELNKLAARRSRERKFQRISDLEAIAEQQQRAIRDRDRRIRELERESDQLRAQLAAATGQPPPLPTQHTPLDGGGELGGGGTSTSHPGLPRPVWAPAPGDHVSGGADDEPIDMSGVLGRYRDSITPPHGLSGDYPSASASTGSDDDSGSGGGDERPRGVDVWRSGRRKPNGIAPSGDAGGGAGDVEMDAVKAEG
ncbi:hypothetical protein M427DRAFT_73151 [Gonapodya prolifera JEL478]|uniref:BZIP domain-containing protein n=1 Tax=Gonapodya prolifera (strain JEL478) TaxID=1344416 RepID=A0A139A4A0_GONPJ|nr:hypothetical protein M427DRAFT_73151 [Gonapodya prolifera JEL478]|eukprot:KXS11183.1 hypothetical protein M427DRAFT_73151 [Gonapodya prolifera JEL478]